MKTVILAGGLGTRLLEQTSALPKPMVEIGGRPILWHIMHVYAAQGFKDFVVALGYRSEAIKTYFLEYHSLRGNVTVALGNGKADFHDGDREDWTVQLIETGLHTLTGGRLKRLRKWLANEPFMLTYGDGVANVDIPALIAHHKRCGLLATVTAVRPPARFGGLRFEGDVVAEFSEKPQIGEGWINGGFFVLEPGVLDYISGDESSFERETLEKLATDRQLAAYRHEDFWQCMDTLRDVRYLNDLWDQNQAPWKLWK